MHALVFVMKYVKQIRFIEQTYNRGPSVGDFRLNSGLYLKLQSQVEEHYTADKKNSLKTSLISLQAQT